MKKIYSDIFICLVCIMTCLVTENRAFNDSSLDNEYRLKSYLLSPTRYNPIVRPTRNHSEALIISVTWRFTGLIKLNWTDEYLTWNPDDYGGLDDTYIIGHHIWTPKLMGSNAIDSHFLDNILDDVYHITSDGMVSVTLNGIISIACHMDPKNFPFDCQKCSVIIDYGGRSKDYVKFKDSGYSNYPTVYHESKTWSLLSTTLEIPNNYDGTIFFFDIVLKRKPYYFVIMIVFPSVLLSIVTLAVYFIPSEEGERIGCGMTILLSFTVFLSQVAEHLPENSDTLPAIGLYFLLVMTSSTLVIVDSVIMANRTSSSPLSKENDETETIEKPDGSDFVGVKTKTCRRNRSAVYHHILGIICFTMIASAHIVLFAKSISASCDNVGL